MTRKALFMLAVLLTFSAVLSAQTAEDVIAKVLEAQGGKERLMAIQSSKAMGTAILQGGAVSGQVVLLYQAPGMVREELNLMGSKIVQAYDGEDAWKIVPAAIGGKGTPEPMTEEEASQIKIQVDLRDVLINYKEEGHEIEYAGTEDLEGTQVHHLKVTHSSGKVFDQYYDVDSGLPLKNVSKQFIPQAGQELEVHLYFSDFKEVEGLMLPHSIENKIAGQTAIHIKLEKIELNGEIDRAVFSRPSGDSQ